MDLKTLVMSRYAAKKFDGKPIDQKKIDELFEIIRHAPSSFNLQPWKIKVVTDKKIKEQIQKAAWNQEQVTTSSHLLVFCANTEVSKLIDKLEADMKAGGVPADTIKTYVGMMRDFDNNMTPEARLSWVQRQLYIALENAMLGATALGFASCPMEGFDPAQVNKILKLPSTLHATVMCPVGYPADKARPKMRFAREDVFF